MRLVVEEGMDCRANQSAALEPKEQAYGLLKVQSVLEAN